MAIRDGTTDECVHCGTVCVWESMARYDKRTGRTPSPDDTGWGYNTRKRWNHFAPVEPDRPWGCPVVVEESSDGHTWNHTPHCLPTNYCGHRITSEDSDQYNQPCNRKVVDDELHLCGIHASKEREAMREQSARDQRLARDQFLEDYVEHVFLPKLKEMGFPDNTYQSHSSYGSRTIARIDLDNFIAWLDQLELK